MQKLSQGLTIAEAEVLAAKALGHMAGDPQLFGDFLGETGISLARLREVADEPGFLGGVLEFLLRNEAALLDFAQNAGIPAEQVATAQLLLSGDRGAPG